MKRFFLFAAICGTALQLTAAEELIDSRYKPFAPDAATAQDVARATDDAPSEIPEERPAPEEA